jgi:hypothetical protein
MCCSAELWQAKVYPVRDAEQAHLVSARARDNSFLFSSTTDN